MYFYSEGSLTSAYSIKTENKTPSRDAPSVDCAIFYWKKYILTPQSTFVTIFNTCFEINKLNDVTIYVLRMILRINKNTSITGSSL
jgi:hypothetical protein